MSATRQLPQTSTQGGRSQLLFRQLNEQIRSLAGPEPLVVVCECTNDSCLERLTITLEEYEAVRRFPTRFLVKEGHVALDVEREVDRRKGFVVVEKSGADAEHAILLDPRRTESGRLRVVADNADRPSRREVKA